MPAATEQSVDFPAPFAPSSAVDLAPFDLEVDAVEHLGVAVAGDDPAHRERGGGHLVVRQRRRRRVHRVGALAGRSGAASVPRTSSCSGTTPPWASASTAAMRARRAFSRFLRSFCWPASERMPSGSWASWIAPRPDRIGTK